MQIFKLLPAFVTAGAASAASLEPRSSRSDCLRDTTENAALGAPRKADVAICYHGDNASTSDDAQMNKDDDHFGYFYKTSCNHRRVGLDCFWMKGPNVWRGYKDGGFDNVYVKYFNNKCSYDGSTVAVTCSG
ncbi:related to conserved hypothetical Ustilaginaceae-specific protein [Moesziomyces antarcticus]|uniref:Related to conserved hypothetical Ustilaginaceae-specific protein n=1 Tax=Pseudozyma antarctica TaxID=84753 RepID=A0A5C3FNY3_PSEA2|nr:related to conserved hypothetical Ustilaginaceae-specific protein [Moesziomyces antarcticus]